MSDDSNPSASNLNPITVLAALASVPRWQIIQMMMNGEELTINGLVAATKRSYKAVHKDMGVLVASGVAACRFGDDGRVGLFYIPEQFRPQPGVLDYGFCRLRFGNSARQAESPMAKD